MKRVLNWLLVAATAATAACSSDSLSVPNTNSPTDGGVATNPRDGAQFLAAGVMAADRNVYDDYILGVGNFGRESFNIFPTDGRTVTGWYQNFADNAGFGSGLFGGYYTNLRNILGFDNLVQGSSVFSAGEKSGATGFRRTEEALNLYYVIATRNSQGAPTRVGVTPDTIFAFQSRDSVLSALNGLLDQGNTALTASGAAFPFTFPGAQFAGATTPATYAKFNRALAARVFSWRASLAAGAARTALYNQALTAITAATTAPTPFTLAITVGNRGAGPSHIYNVTAGDSPNGLFAQTSAQGYYANPDLQTVFGTDSTADNRFNAYLATAPSVAPNSANVTTTKRIVRWPLQTSPIPVITNEELLLIRAEALYFTGNTAGALADINLVRTTAGLAARGAFANDAAFIDELLIQRTRSLVGLGHRWNDYRRFGRLATLPNSGALFRKTANMVITQQECVVRSRNSDASLACPAFSQTDAQNPVL